MESVELNVQKAKLLVAEAGKQTSSPTPFKRQLLAASLLPPNKPAASTPPQPTKTSFSPSKSNASNSLKESFSLESTPHKAPTSDPNKQSILQSMLTYLFTALSSKAHHFLHICRQSLHEELIQTAFADKLTSMHLIKKSLLSLKLNAKYCRQRRKSGARILLRVVRGVLSDSLDSDLQFAVECIRAKQLRIADIISERLDEDEDSKTREQPPVTPEPLEHKTATLTPATPIPAATPTHQPADLKTAAATTSDPRAASDKKKTPSASQLPSSKRSQQLAVQAVASKSPIRQPMGSSTSKPTAHQSTATLVKSARPDSLRISTDDASYLKKKVASKWTSSTAATAKITFTPRSNTSAIEKSPSTSRTSHLKKPPSTPKAALSPKPEKHTPRRPPHNSSGFKESVVHTSILELESESNRLSKSSSTAMAICREATDHSRTPTTDIHTDSQQLTDEHQQVLDRYWTLKRKKLLG